jgi:RNA polymerase sigma-B factor
MDLRLLDERGEPLFAAGTIESTEELTHLYLPLAEYLARRFVGRGEPVDDLVQVASIGLLKAIDRFDAKRGVRFTTYAIPTIVGELKRYFRDSCWAIRVPRRVQEIGLRLRETVSALNQELGRSPTMAEIADALGVTTEQVLEAVDATHCYTVGSLEAAAFAGDDGSSSLEDRLGAPDGDMERIERWAEVEPLLEAYPPRERRILSLRFARGLTQIEIAELVGISQMHVSRLLARMLDELRVALTAQERRTVDA